MSRNLESWISWHLWLNRKDCANERGAKAWATERRGAKCLKRCCFDSCEVFEKVCFRRWRSVWKGAAAQHQSRTMVGLQAEILNTMGALPIVFPCAHIHDSARFYIFCTARKSSHVFFQISFITWDLVIIMSFCASYWPNQYKFGSRDAYPFIRSR